MRGLSELERVETPAPGESAADKAAWGPPQGLMFLGGLLLAIGLAALAYFYPNRPHIVFDTVSMQHDIGSLNAQEAWEMWQEMRKGLNRAPTELSSVYQNALSIYQRRLWMSGGLAVLGAVLLAAGLALRLGKAGPRTASAPRG
jgi:hypothetical protein